jgi:hypothetical protein
MTDQPSAASIAATTEVLELASLLDHRIPRPDKARILAWAKQVDRHRLGRDDLLDAVQAFYDRPSAQPVSVGDVVAGAKRIKRDRLDREDEAQRDTRRAEADTKAADEVRAISAVVLSGRVTEAARDGLATCYGRHGAMAAIREFFAAKTQARK